jgi:large subunit ribosomal protein L24
VKKLRKGDDVIVLAGKDKGKRGTVQRVLENDRVLVDGVNIVRRHVKPNPMRGTQGGIVDQERSIHLSNIALFNPQKSAADKVGIRNLEDGRKVRFFKSNDEVVDV